jgi:hypothetical protein
MSMCNNADFVSKTENLVVSLLNDEHLQVRRG